MHLMNNPIGRNSLPTSDSENVSSAMLSPVESVTTESSFANSGNDSSDLDDLPVRRQSSQLEQLKKVFARKPRDPNDSLSASNGSLSLRGEQVFRIAIDEDSAYEEKTPTKSSRWQRTVGAVAKPPSVQRMEAEDDDEGYSSRRSPLRSLVDDDLMDLDDSTHPIPSLQPPSISSLGTYSSKMNKSSKSVDTATTIPMSDQSFLGGKRRSSLVSHSDSLYSQFSGSSPGKGGFPKNMNGSSRANLGMYSSLDFTEASMASRTSTIRSYVEQSLDESTHELPSPGPLRNSLTETSNTSRLRSEIFNDDDSSVEESSRTAAAASSRKGRKSRSPRPPAVQARETSSGRSIPRRSPPRPRSGNSKSPSTSSSVLRSSPHKRAQVADAGLDELSSPSMRGERKVLGSPPREERFQVRRTVSSPVKTTRKMMPSNERSERMRRSITDGSVDERRGVSVQSERGIRSIHNHHNNNNKSPSFQRSISNSPGVRLRPTPLDKRKSHSTRAERSIPVDFEDDDEEEEEVSLKERGGNPFYSKQTFSFETESGDESIKMEEDHGTRIHLRPFRGTIPRSSSEGNNIRSSMSEHRSVNTTVLHMDMTGIRTTTRSTSPGIRFSRSAVRRTTPVHKRKSHSTRAERTIPIDMDFDEGNLQRPSKLPSADAAANVDDSGEKTTLGQKVMDKIKRRHSTRAERTIPIHADPEDGTKSGKSEPFTVGNEVDSTEKATLGQKVMDKMKRRHSTRTERSIDIPVEPEDGTKSGKSEPFTVDEVDDSGEKATLGQKVMDKMKRFRRHSLSLRGNRSIAVELDGEEEAEAEEPAKPQSKSMRDRRSIDMELEEEEPKLKSKSARGRRSIDVALDEPKPKTKSSRGRRSIDVDSDEEEGKGKKSKSSRRERRSIDVELSQEGKKSKSSRRERRTLSIDLDLGSDDRKEKSKSSGRRTLSVDSGDSISERPKGVRSLVTENLEDAPKTAARTRARSRKKDSPKKKSKSPKKKKPNKSDQSDDEAHESTSLDTKRDVSIEETEESKPRSSSPSSLFKKLKGIREERSNRKAAGRSHSPKRELEPPRTLRKPRMSIA